jgi:hypothetical protein
MDSVSKINLACGREYLDGYLNVDNGSFYPDAKIDLRENIETMGWVGETIDEVRLSHFAMYLRPEQMSKLLKRWCGWLKNGGKIVIETIDVKKVAKIVADAKTAEEMNSWGLTNLYGNPLTCPHQWGWCPKTLTSALYEAGFSDVKITKGTKKPSRDFTATATK